MARTKQTAPDGARLEFEQFFTSHGQTPPELADFYEARIGDYLAAPPGQDANASCFVAEFTGKFPSGMTFPQFVDGRRLVLRDRSGFVALAKAFAHAPFAV